MGTALQYVDFQKVCMCVRVCVCVSRNLLVNSLVIVNVQALQFGFLFLSQFYCKYTRFCVDVF